MEHQTLPVHLSLPLLKHLLGTPMTFSDLEIIDPELHRSLRWIRENKQVSVLHLDFTVTVEVLGQRKVVELKPEGSKIPLTDENKVRGRGKEGEEEGEKRRVIDLYVCVYICRRNILR